MNLVVGSGPSGVAAALALLERGHSVTMLDVGREIEPAFAELPRRLAGLPYEQWPDDAIRRLAAIEGPVLGGYPMKTNFGSDFAYREEPALMPLDVRDADILQSFARGGLSNLWGANVFSFGANDLKGWPLDEAALAPAYRAVLRHVPLSAARGDDFEAILPLYKDELEPRFLSSQAEKLLADLRGHGDALHARGVRFGPSRLGIRTSPAAGSPGCVRCGFCLHGCPLDIIYCSAQTLARLREHPNFRYEPGVYVERFEESERGVVVHARRTSDRAPLRFEGARAFVGGGCYSSARLVLESTNRFGVEVTMRESQYFLVPLLHWHGFPDAPHERMQTLSQICLRLSDAKVCEHDVQMLIYTYSNLYRGAIARTPARLFPPLAKALLGRLLALQGYLHSDVSPTLALSLRRDAKGVAVLEVRGRENPATTPVVRRVEARLRAISGMLKASPIPFMSMISTPGKSYHGGAIFPMRREPAPGGSDLLGRPLGLARVHVVDASVFPNIPATNLTLTVMANAYRIASESSALDGARAAAGGASA